MSLYFSIQGKGGTDCSADLTIEKELNGFVEKRENMAYFSVLLPYCRFNNRPACDRLGGRFGSTRDSISSRTLNR
ncbi:hypothetical protein [Paenibacillus sp. HJGM_3]|uniref:hypothetical protein n=1 Tax=Paenibacillus sp. HJGM_3 TaxID=3379816 RepID=UPI003858C4B4